LREENPVERAKGMDARSERPARWHGPTPSPCRFSRKIEVTTPPGSIPFVRGGY
jgi:hypothetical protein